MNIIEALRTGKPLRRPIPKHKGATRSEYMASDYVKKLLTSKSSASVFDHSDSLINEIDLMADDWEVKLD